jgi:hypothetical protein
MTMKAARPAEPSGTVRRIKQLDIPGELKLYHYRCENFGSRKTPILERGVSGTLGCGGIVFGVSAGTA